MNNYKIYSKSEFIEFTSVNQIMRVNTNNFGPEIEYEDLQCSYLFSSDKLFSEITLIEGLDIKDYIDSLNIIIEDDIVDVKYRNKNILHATQYDINGETIYKIYLA